MRFLIPISVQLFNELEVVVLDQIYISHSENNAAFPAKNTLSPAILQYSVPPRFDA